MMYAILYLLGKKKMQAITLKRYPAQLSLTTWMSFIGAAQSAVFTVCIEHKRAAWTVGFNIDLWSILYAVSFRILKINLKFYVIRVNG